MYTIPCIVIVNNSHYPSVKYKNEKFSLSSDSCENLNNSRIIRTAATQNKSKPKFRKRKIKENFSINFHFISPLKLQFILRLLLLQYRTDALYCVSWVGYTSMYTLTSIEWCLMWRQIKLHHEKRIAFFGKLLNGTVPDVSFLIVFARGSTHK